MSLVDRDVFEIVDDPAGQGATWVRASVDLDLLSAADAQEQLNSICTKDTANGYLVVEVLAECFVDIRGLRVLLEHSRLLQERGGALVLVSMSRELARLLQVLELDGELPFVRTVEEACREVCRGT
jgi:anti-anti-sigma factor